MTQIEYTLKLGAHHYTLYTQARSSSLKSSNTAPLESSFLHRKTRVLVLTLYNSISIYWLFNLNTRKYIIPVAILAHQVGFDLVHEALEALSEQGLLIWRL